MIRPGSSVKSPATTRPPEKIAIMARRCARIRCLRARQTASGSMTSTKIDNRGPMTDQPDLMDPERTDRNGQHKQDPDPADGAMGQGPFRRGKLDQAEHKGGHRREGMELNRRVRIEQRRQTHDRISRLTIPHDKTRGGRSPFAHLRDFAGSRLCDAGPCPRPQNGISSSISLLRLPPPAAAAEPRPL